MTLSPSRHGWAWIDRHWSGEACDVDEIELWRRAGRPFVVARKEPDDTEDCVRLGLALPDKRRIGLRLDRRHIARVAPPLFLADAIASAPIGWRPMLEALDQTCRSFGCAPRLYGSLAWQHVSGEPYLRSDSDVDLIFSPHNLTSFDRLIGCLQTLRDAPKLDGEILFPCGGAVAWRELAAAAEQVLVKRADSVALTPRATMLDQLAA